MGYRQSPREVEIPPPPPDSIQRIDWRAVVGVVLGIIAMAMALPAFVGTLSNWGDCYLWEPDTPSVLLALWGLSNNLKHVLLVGSATLMMS
jgi:hypothetical protein